MAWHGAKLSVRTTLPFVKRKKSLERIRCYHLCRLQAGILNNSYSLNMKGPNIMYEGVSKSFRTGRLEREL